MSIEIFSTKIFSKKKPINQILINTTHQDAIKSWRISTSLNVTQNSDSRVLSQLIDNDFLNHLSGDGISLAICGAFGHDNDVQTLTSRTFLSLAIENTFIIFSMIFLNKKWEMIWWNNGNILKFKWMSCAGSLLMVTKNDLIKKQSKEVSKKKRL